MNSDDRRKIVNAGIGKLKFAQKKTLSEQDFLIHKAMTLTEAVRTHILPILKERGFFTDKPALTDLITRCYLDGFAKFSKDELENLCTMLHVQIMLESIEQNPLGGSKPDLLSGV